MCHVTSAVSVLADDTQQVGSETSYRKQGRLIVALSVAVSLLQNAAWIPRRFTYYLLGGVVPISIPVSENASLSPKMLVSVSVSTPVCALIPCDLLATNSPLLLPN